jgi:hypothetical protein
MVTHGILRLLVLVALAGCATTSDSVQRTLEGPRADEIWMSRFAQSYGRTPSFAETSLWREALDQKVADYLNRNPEILTSPRASQFRFQRRVFPGMSKDEVVLLLEAPEESTTDEATMSAAAQNFWPDIKRRAQEMWRYPSGWRLYFAGDRLVDVTVTGRPPIE